MAIDYKQYGVTNGISGIAAAGRMYALGNDRPDDVGRRDETLEDNTWVASSYLDGIYTEASTGYISGAWNMYHLSLLPQSAWTDYSAISSFSDLVNYSGVYSPEYGKMAIVPESSYNPANYISGATVNTDD